MKKQIINDFLDWLNHEHLNLINENAKIIVAVYIRVSTDKQEELSPLSQLKEIYKYTIKHDMQINIDSIFVEEEGISGKNAIKRNEFQNMIAHAKLKEKQFSTILVWKFSRFARNQEESIVYKNMLKKNNVDVVSISEPLIDGPFGSLIERIIEWMDEYYLINLSGEVTRGMTEKAERGEPQSSPAFGYDIKDNKLIPNEKEAPIVQFIYEKYASGELEMINIAKYLNEHHFTTKRGKRWENRTIWYVLTNPVYIGKIRWTPNGKLTREEIYDNTKSIITNGNHQAIISEELYNKARERLNHQRKFSVKRQRISNNPHHWLKGLIRCGECDRTFVRSNHKFRCNGYNKGACSCSATLSIDSIEKLVLKQIQNDSKSLLNINILKNEKTNTSNLSELKILEKQLELSTEKLDRIKIAFQSGIDTMEEYKTNKKNINEEINLLKKEIYEKKHQNNEDNNIENKIIWENMATVYDLLTNEKVDMKKKYDIAHFLIKKIIYDEKNNNLKLYYNEV